MRKTVLTSISALAIAFALPALAETSTQDIKPAPTAGEVEINEASEGQLPVSDDLNAAANATEPVETMDMTPGEPETPMNPVAQMPRDEILGRQVVTKDGEKAGDVDDLLLNKDNQVTHVVVGVGGFFGFGAKPVSLPVQKLALADDNALAVDLTLQELEGLPAAEKSTQ